MERFAKREKKRASRPFPSFYTSQRRKRLKLVQGVLKMD